MVLLRDKPKFLLNKWNKKYGKNILGWYEPKKLLGTV